MQTREQRYATAVYSRVEARTYNGDQEKKNKYGAMAHKLPVLIRSAGLAQALAFVDTRKDVQKDILCDLEIVLRETGCLAQNQQLLARSRQAEIGEYMLLTEHSLAALLWFKRFAQSLLEVEGTGE